MAKWILSALPFFFLSQIVKFSKLYTKTALRIPIRVGDTQENLATDIENFMSHPQQDISGMECVFCASYQKTRRRKSGRNGLGQSGR